MAPSPGNPPSIMIDEIAGKHGHGIQTGIRSDAQQVRKLRNDWAHESDEDPGPLTIDEARHRLQRYLSQLPETW